MEAVDLIVFSPKGLHHADGGDALLHGRGNVRQAFLNHGAGGFELTAEYLHRLSDQWHRDERQKAELPIQEEHHDERTDEDRTLRHQLDEPIHQRILQRRHIIRDVAHDLPRLMAVEIGEGEPLKLLKEDVPHVYDNTLPDKRH